MSRTRGRMATLAVITSAGVAAGSLAAVAFAATTTRRLSNAGSEFSFTATKLTARPGTVVLVFRNAGNADHNIALRGKNLKSPYVGSTAAAGETSKVTVPVKKGTYTFFCGLPGHEKLGMRGTLVVR